MRQLERIRDLTEQTEGLAAVRRMMPLLLAEANTVTETERRLSATRADETQFERRYGLRDKEPFLILRSLDPAIRTELNLIAPDVAATKTLPWSPPQYYAVCRKQFIC